MRIFKAILAGLLVAIGLSPILAAIIILCALPIISIIGTIMVSYIASG